LTFPIFGINRSSKATLGKVRDRENLSPAQIAYYSLVLL